MTIIGSESMPPGCSVTHLFYPANDYEHPPSGFLDLRLVTRGSSSAKIDLGKGPRNVFTRPGDLLLSLPHSSTRFRIEEGRNLILLRIAPDFASAALAESGAVLNDLIALTEGPFRESLIAEVCRRLGAAESLGSPSVRHALKLIVGLMLARARKQAARVGPPQLSQRRLAEIVRYVDGRLAKSISVEDLARVAKMPARRFSAAFRDVTGLPVYQFVLRRRAEYARALLTSTRGELAEIAQKSGFSHQAHMNRVVKRLLGQTPAQIREGA